MSSRRPLCNEKQDIPPTQETHRARFFEEDREEAGGCDRVFTKKHDEGLNTTLIFVNFA